METEVKRGRGRPPKHESAREEFVEEKQTHAQKWAEADKKRKTLNKELEWTIAKVPALNAKKQLVDKYVKKVRRADGNTYSFYMGRSDKLTEEVLKDYQSKIGKWTRY